MGARISTPNQKKRTLRLKKSILSTDSITKSNTHTSTCSSIPDSAISITDTKPSSTSSKSSDSIFRQGRRFHNEEKSTYWFPIDEEEMDRLMGEQFALKALFGGNIPQVVAEDTRVPFNKGARILDLGCGPGTWIMDVATEYPNSEFIGIDISDVFPINIRPPNVTFQIGNVNEGLNFPDNTFDVVNFSFFIICLAADEWLPILKEVKRVLKPGGYILSREPGMLEIGNEFIKWAGWIFKEKMAEQGQDPYIAIKMQDHMKSAGFDVVQCIKKDTFPGRTDRLNREFLWDLQHIFKSAQPFLEKDLGISPEKYPEFIKTLAYNLQLKPESQWSMVATVGQKPAY